MSIIKIFFYSSIKLVLLDNLVKNRKDKKPALLVFWLINCYFGCTTNQIRTIQILTIRIKKKLFKRPYLKKENIIKKAYVDLIYIYKVFLNLL